MMTLWSPWRTLANELEFFAREPENNTAMAFSPRVDITEQPDHYRIDVDLPGVEASTVSVTVEHSVLTIAGERKDEKRAEAKGYYRYERVHGSFSRAFRLPEDVDSEHITAASKNGVLTVQIPKAAVAKPRSIEVKTLS
jgi:HSP20 family protein